MRIQALSVSLAACALACNSDRRAPGCIQSPPRTDAPGDPNDYFPVTTGSFWNYEISSPSTLPALGHIEVVGTRASTGGQIFRSAIQGDAATVPVDTYYSKTATGVTEEQGSATGPLTSLVLPFQRLSFPLDPNRDVVQVDCAALDLGGDFDGDSLHDHFDYQGRILSSSAEDVAVPWGSLRAVPVKTTTNIALHGTRGLSLSEQDVLSEWYAAGVGLVRSTLSQVVQTGSFPGTTFQLLGYSVEGQAKGLLRYRQVAAGVAPPGSDVSQPGQPAVSFDGSSHLVVSAQSGAPGASAPSKGTLVAADGTASPPVQLADSGYGGKAAFDGANHLVVLHGCVGPCGYIGQRVTPSGALLDGSGGFPVSDMSEDARLSALAFGGSRYLFVYARFAGGNVDIRGVRIDPGGAALDNFSVRGPMPAPATGDNSPSLAFDGQDFLVAWAEAPAGESTTSRIVAVRVTPAGAVLDSPPLAISTSPGSKSLGGVACDGTQCLVAWSGLPAGGSGFADLHATRVDRNGSLLDGPPESDGILVNALANQSKAVTSVTYDGRDFVLAWWIDGYVSPAGVYAARISPQGAVLDQTATGTLLSRVTLFDSRAVLPSIVPAGLGRTLVAWVYNSETAGVAKNVEAIWYQW